MEIAMKSSEIDNTTALWTILCGDMAPIVTIVLRLIPISTVYKFTSSGDLRKMPLMPYTGLVCNSILWTLFGLLEDDTRILISHFVGLIVSCLYCYFYVKTYEKYASKDDGTLLPGTISQHLCFILSTAIVGAAVLMMPHEYARDLIGIGADFGSVLMYAGPMSTLRIVLRERNAASLSLAFAIMCFINAGCWFLYGWYVSNDILVWGPSLIGLILACTQLLLIGYFGDRDERKLISKDLNDMNESIEFIGGEDDDITVEDLIPSILPTYKVEKKK